MVIERTVLSIQIGIAYGKDSNIVATYLADRIKRLTDEMKGEGTLLGMESMAINLEDEIKVL